MKKFTKASSLFIIAILVASCSNGTDTTSGVAIQNNSAVTPESNSIQQQIPQNNAVAENNNTAQTNNISGTTITAEEAKAIALKHAGITEADVSFVKCQLEYDDGVQEYEVEFYVGNKEYDYDINAATGEIISFDFDMETPKPSTSTTNNTSSTTITAEEAKAIALKHAGITESDVSFVKCQLEYDDGVQEYEVEFYVGNKEYDYDINAATGEIISFDFDMESSMPNTAGSTSVAVTAEQAKTTALNHAGTSASNVTSLKCELDYDDGVAVYEIEFKIGHTEYEYEINATTGAIKSYDIDND